jgi:ribulose-phosphate 3-epimerase
MERNIRPSILTADFTKLGEEVKHLVDAGADALHLDVMDGHFVPNLSMGPAIVAAVNRATDIFLDVHLMIYNPYDYIERFVEAGADSITIHLEATEEVEATLQFIRRCGAKAGLAICPETSASLVLNYLNKCDMVLLMTVNPGFGGQAFMPEVVEKIEFLRQTCDTLGIRQGGVTPTGDTELPPFDIQVDGGINAETAKICADAGANVFVAGSYLFKNEDTAAAIASLR